MRTGRPATKEPSTLGQRISTARREAGITQQHLANKLGTTQRVITYWERESVGLKAEQLNALAEALGVTLDKLMGRPQPKSRGNGPVGRAKQIFEAVSKLPRKQQEKVFDILQPFLREHSAPKAS